MSYKIIFALAPSIPALLALTDYVAAWLYETIHQLPAPF